VAPGPPARAAPRRTLSTIDAIVLVVGLVLGVGIFRSPQIVAENAGGGATFMLLWVAGGLVSLVGALTYAELATAYPHAGGEYHFLTRAFGGPVGFLFAWSRMTVIQTGSIAILSFVFADYAAELLGLGGAASPALAATAVVVLTLVNVAGLRQGRGTQYALTTVEVLGLVAVICAGWLLAGPAARAGTPALPEGGAARHLGLALVFVLLTFGGWSELAYLSAELLDVRRGASRALLWSMAILTALYLLANGAYLKGLGLAGVAGSPVVASDLMRATVGAWGAAAVGLTIVVSALSSANATIITGARSNFALGRDYNLLAFLGVWRERSSTPARSLLVQGAIALLLVGFGALTRSGFAAMVAYTAPVFWLILLLTGVSLFVLRAREPDRPRPFRVPLYPATPLAFCLAAAFMLYSSLAYAGAGAALGICVMLAGLPLLARARRRQGAAPARERAAGP
jgi:amino acid transporter